LIVSFEDNGGVMGVYCRENKIKKGAGFPAPFTKSIAFPQKL